MSTNPATPFAEAFERLRSSRGWSPAETARRLSALAGRTIYPTEVSRWRHGKGGISIQNVRLVADLFGVDRADLERLAGYGDSYEGITQDTTDPAITALLDAERADTHEELKGIEPQFWPVIIEAGRLARQTAAKLARMATPQSNSAADALPNSANPAQSSKFGKGVTRRAGTPKSGGYLVAATV